MRFNWNIALRRARGSENALPFAESMRNLCKAIHSFEARRSTPNARTTRRLLLAALWAVHGVMLAYSAAIHSPTLDEPGHVVAGVSHWRLGRFDLYRVNPPLVRAVAAIPVLATRARFTWQGYNPGDNVRSEDAVRDHFIAENAELVLWIHTIARWACIPFSLIGAVTCYCWARRLYGELSGLVASLLWCFSPSVLGHGSLITPDVGAAAFGALAGYRFWRWLVEPSFRCAFFAGVALGVAELAKTTLLVLIVLWAPLWITYRLAERLPAPAKTWRVQGAQIGFIFILAGFVLNLGYGFDGSFRRLGDFHFVSKTLAGSWKSSGSLPGDNRFKDSWLASLPVPVPRDYLLGIDLQKLDFDRKKWSYLCGEWKHGGWWYYYLYALAVKSPLGFVLLAAVAALSHLPRSCQARLRDEAVLVVPAAAIALLVSSQTGMCHHYRYILPAFPFGFVWMSRAAAARATISRGRVLLISCALLWGVGSSVAYFPHSMSYFNELAGGPLHGHWHLGHSCTEWGQDLIGLKHWLDSNPDVREIAVSCEPAFIKPSVLGITATDVPVGPGCMFARGRAERELGPHPGWFAIGVNRLHYPFREYSYFLDCSPVARIGYSILIYHLTADEANRVRVRTGLSPLPVNPGKDGNPS